MQRVPQPPEPHLRAVSGGDLKTCVWKGKNYGLPDRCEIRGDEELKYTALSPNDWPGCTSTQYITLTLNGDPPVHFARLWWWVRLCLAHAVVHSPIMRLPVKRLWPASRNGRPKSSVTHFGGRAGQTSPLRGRPTPSCAHILQHCLLTAGSTQAIESVGPSTAFASFIEEKRKRNAFKNGTWTGRIRLLRH